MKKKGRSCGIGGQAVLEGVMMKNKDRYAVSVRKPNGEIETDTEEFRGILHDSVLKRLPFVRGVFNFVDSMTLGMRTLTWSVSFFEEDGESDPQKPSLFQKLFGDRADDVAMGITTTVSIVLAVGVFMILPYYISSLLSGYVRNASLTAMIEGLIRILIFVAYVVGISAMKDIHRLYQYHGAEHKCINCIERGRPLTVRNVMRSSRQHRRCGTSFLLFVMLVSVILFFFIRVENPVYRVGLRILLIPVIAGISYEIIRLAGNSNNILVRILSAPGMWLQKLTTKEPDEEMAEVAIASVEAVFDWRAYLKDTFDYEVEEETSGGKVCQEETVPKELMPEEEAFLPEMTVPEETGSGETGAEVSGYRADESTDADVYWLEENGVDELYWEEEAAAEAEDSRKTICFRSEETHEI